jgi:hypothetical protein
MDIQTPTSTDQQLEPLNTQRKQAYVKPQLTLFGTLATLTQTNNVEGNPDIPEPQTLTSSGTF